MEEEVGIEEFGGLDTEGLGERERERLGGLALRLVPLESEGPVCFRCGGTAFSVAGSLSMAFFDVSFKGGLRGGALTRFQFRPSFDYDWEEGELVLACRKCGWVVDLVDLKDSALLEVLTDKIEERCYSRFGVRE